LWRYHSADFSIDRLAIQTAGPLMAVKGDSFVNLHSTFPP
jgi:hypothetical protein